MGVGPQRGKLSLLGTHPCLPPKGVRIPLRRRGTIFILRLCQPRWHEGLLLLLLAGTAMAAFAVPPGLVPPKPVAAASPASDATLQLAQADKTNPSVERAELVLRSSLDAYGGQEKLLAVQEAAYIYQVVTETDPPSKPVTVKTYFKGDTYFRSEVGGENQEAISILSGGKGWVQVGGATLSLSKSELLPLRNGLAAQLRPDLLLLSFPKHRFTVRTEEANRTLDQIEVSGFMGGEYVRGRLSIDVATHLLFKYEYELERDFPSGKGIVRGEEQFVQYREVEGLQVPSLIISRQGKKVSKLTLEKAEFNSALPASLFEDPSPKSAGQ
jgi:hypothetical protein